MPTVSVVIPTYNREELVRRAIDSALDQTYTDVEILVVDDASDDDTADVVRGCEDDRVTYVAHEENRGGSAARNTGIDRARGKYVAFLDSDDYWLPEKLARQVQALETRTDEWVSVYCASDKQRQSRVKSLFSALFDRAPTVEGDTAVIEELLYLNFGFDFGSTLLAERAAVDRAGGFDESMPRHQDVEFALRLLQEGKMAYVDEQLAITGESPAAAAKDIETAKRLLFEKHRSLVDEVSGNTDTIERIHRFHLANCFFREGAFRQGLQYLRRGRAAHPRQYARLSWSMYQGLRQLPNGND